MICFKIKSKSCDKTYYIAGKNPKIKTKLYSKMKKMKRDNLGVPDKKFAEGRLLLSIFYQFHNYFSFVEIVSMEEFPYLMKARHP